MDWHLVLSITALVFSIGYGRPGQRDGGDYVAEVQVHIFFLPSFVERFGLCDYKPIAAEEGA